MKDAKVCYDADVCIVGGSCTGLFAAVRAARLGARVVLVEKQNCFGGTATSGHVNIWHSLYDIDNKNQIIAGLTDEVVSRLRLRKELNELNTHAPFFQFNPSDLKIELDKLVVENKIKVYLHTFYAGIVKEQNNITKILIANKDGLKYIQAKFFIDATGDGDLARDLGIESYTHGSMQPPTACFLMQGDIKGLNVQSLIQKHGAEFNLDLDWGWWSSVPNLNNITMRADTHVFNVTMNNADDLTYSEIEGRRQMRAICDLLNKYGKENEKYAIVSTCSQIGIRESTHFVTKYKMVEDALLLGKTYEDAVLKGTYRIDIHHHDDIAITFKYLGGKQEILFGDNRARQISSWYNGDSKALSEIKYYQTPFDILISKPYTNFIAVGRMINADKGAFGALRVMVNLNQLGEAAGVAAYLAVNSNLPIQELDGKKVRQVLKNGGSAL